MVLRREAELRPNNGFHAEITKLSLFNGKVSKIKRFVIVCKLYMKMRMREMMVKEEIQWVLTYV